ncbi:unnamed protein product [Zymoseptoria tritici ST99CH_3D1]|nr:unnamed protein product [Zymoseptoria tritici ST99CH_3D1]
MRARYQVTTRLPTVRSPAIDMCTEYVGQTKKIPKSARDDDEARRGEAERRLKKDFSVTLKDVIRSQFKRINVPSSDEGEASDKDDSEAELFARLLSRPMSRPTPKIKQADSGGISSARSLALRKGGAGRSLFGGGVDRAGL